MTSNDDRNLKKLADGMAAMSPEPPPFPDEVTMTNQNPNPRFKPLTIFAGAALLVLLGLGIPLILINSDDGPVALPETTTTTVDETTTTTRLGTTTTSDGTVPVVGDTVVFFLQDPENSFLGNPALVPFAIPVVGTADTDPTLFALQSLLPVDAELEPPEGFYSSIPSGVEIVSLVEGPDFTATLDMSENFLNGAGGLLADVTMLNQLVYTATADPDITSVLFTVNGEPIEAFGSEGLILTDPVDRESFQDELSLIYLTSPILPNADGNVVVEGISNTFEASVSLRVVDSAGGVIHEEFTTATCGSGCWGDYLFVLDPDLFVGDVSVEIFEYSAEDGDPEDVLTVPYNRGELWDLLPSES